VSDERPNEERAAQSHDDEESILDDVEVRDLLRKALDRDSSGDGPSVLRGVQERLRTETSGQFFADGWGTAPTPRQTYLMTSLLLLGLLVLAWLLLGPWGVRILD